MTFRADRFFVLRVIYEADLIEIQINLYLSIDFKFDLTGNVTG